MDIYRLGGNEYELPYDLCDIHMNIFCRKRKTRKKKKIIIIMRFDCLLYVNHG